MGTKAHWMHVEMVPDKAGEKTEAYDLFPTVIGHDTFLNVVMIGKDDQGHPTKGYYFLRYTVSGNHALHMWMISQDAAAAAVRAGKIQGVVRDNHTPVLGVKPPHPDVDVTLQDTSANLVAFIQGSDAAKLFSDKMETLYRVKTAGLNSQN